MDTLSEKSIHQEISIRDRSMLSVTAVEDVRSFDESCIILKSGYGLMAIDGSDLHITQLSVDTGELLVEGKISGVVFFEADAGKKKRRFFS